MYCFGCRLFPSSSGYVDTTFTTEGCKKWKNIGEKLKRHVEIRGSQREHGKNGWLTSRPNLLLQVGDQLTSQTPTVAANCMYKGNYAEILELLASVMPELGHQFCSLPNNAKYTSKVVQNDLLKATTEVVFKEITDEVKEAELLMRHEISVRKSNLLYALDM